MKKVKPFFLCGIVLGLMTLSQSLGADQGYGPSDYSKSDITKVVMLGTGTPNPDPERSGPCVGIIVNKAPYIVDFGDGLIRQAAKISPRFGGKAEAMEIRKFNRAFLTHLHSDHTMGFADLILTPWVMGRAEPLEVYGPEGIVEMSENLLKAYDIDIKYRLYGLEPANNFGWRVNAHEIKGEGVIYRDENVKVEAFPVVHGSWPNAFGFRFTTPDKVIVISGDCRPNDKILKYAHGADILVHEVYCKKGYDKRNKFWQEYHAANHTSTLELAKLADQAKPGLLILYHVLFFGESEEQVLREITDLYDGQVVLPNDGEFY